MSTARNDGKRRLVTLTIDGREVKASDRATILDVARREGLYIPTLCFDARLASFGACRVCMVGVAGARGPVARCTTPVREGIAVGVPAIRFGLGVSTIGHAG